ncbi:MAG: tRNA lysidine(34) synthetase TilS [Desulfovibrio sp.]|nr:tRNA lysidine(34) synthetase TilS [Desulfovibrio sp.]
MPIKNTLESLSPFSARFCLDVEKHCRDIGLHDCHSILAISGGADSTALAMILALLRKRLGLTLSAVTIDHGLREEAKEEIRGVLRLTTALGIPTVTDSVDVRACARNWKMGIEEAGRKARYKVLERERLRLGADLICTGHQADDLAEDILMRLLRGSGWPALGGMKPLDAKRHLVRPLLPVPAMRLRLFLQDIGVSWFEDASNSDERFTRNRIRHTLLPLATQENPNFLSHCQTLASLASLDAQFFSAELEKALRSCPIEREDGPVLHLKKDLLAALHPSLRLRLYKMVLTELMKEEGIDVFVGSTHLFAIENCLVKRGSGVLSLPKGIEVRIARHAIRILRTPTPHTSSTKKVIS